jgi:hypothetical protein
LGLGRLGKNNKTPQCVLSATEAMERHRTRLKDKEALIEKVRATEAKIRMRKLEIRNVIETNEQIKGDLDKQA